MIPFEIPPGINDEDAFRLCVHFSEFIAKLDDGSIVDVPQNYDEWTVDCQCYTLAMLEKDLGARIKWGSGQQLVVSEFVINGAGERKLLNDIDLSLAFAERKSERKMHLVVGVVDKPTEIDWDTLQITPLSVDQIGAPMPVIDEDTIYDFLGLRAEDERVEQARAAAAEKGKQIALELADELVVDDHVPGEDSVLYDREHPPMEEGTIYSSMPEFRAAVKHYAIVKKFELATEKSTKFFFRGHCKADGRSWSIVARLMHDKQQVRITLNRNEHFCASTGRVKTKMASYKWIAEKAIPFLKKNPNMGSKELQKELQEKYDVTLGYSTVHLGHEVASNQLFGTWEESFGYLFNFKAEIELRMPGSVVEIDVINHEDGVYFHRFFCCLKPSIDGFLNGCRPFLSIDSTALNGRWNGHLPSATALDGCNWMFPVAFGFFCGETTDNWTWFMQQLHKAIGNPPHLAIISDACKGLENAIKTVYPWAEHRECFVHLMKNFSKRFQGPAFGRMYPAARTFQPDYHDYLMNKMYATNKQVEPWLKTNHKLKWMRCKFSEHIKCDAITSNVAEVWNNWVKDIKDRPPASLADSLRSKFMELYARRRRIGEKFEGHVMLPVVVRQLYALSRELGHLKVRAGGREEAEVTEVTESQKIIRHVVNIKNHICTCREWQVSGKPCPHAMALITTCRNPKMEEYLHPYFSNYHFRLAYGGVIRPLLDMSQWTRVNLGFKVLPPLEKREPGRQRKLGIPGCIEGKGNKPRGKGKWQVTCKNCGGLGHRSTSPKCPKNGTKKRRSRAKKGKAGRPPGSTKRQKVDEQGSQGNNSPMTASQFSSAIVELQGTSQINTSPGPVTRSQFSSAIVELQGTSQINTSPGPVTRRQSLSAMVEVRGSNQTGEETLDIVTTPTKSPAKRRLGLKKKLTPRKGRNGAA